MERHGILCAGNWIIDKVKIIDKFPATQETLVNILSESMSNGGSPYNVLKDLAKLQVPFPLYGLGLVGDDENGDYILEDCERNGINTDLLKKTRQAPTSYTDVMTVVSGGKRTFFHNRGTNALLDIEHFPLEESNAKIFNLGYFLLLDKLDTFRSDGLTGAAEILKKAQTLGFITSADSVSEDSDRFAKIVPASLPYLDFFFLNEFEAGKITGIPTTNANGIDLKACEAAAKKLFELGVNRWVIIHFPKGALAVSSKGERIFQGSVRVPSALIKGTVGAGDAFAAGVLASVHEGVDMQEALKAGVCTSSTCLLDPGSSGGIRPLKESLAFGESYDFWPN